MPFDLKIVFTGLVLVCAPGEQPCKEVGDHGVAYLVNATHGKEICGRWMDGGHRPRLALDERHLLPGSTQRYEYFPQPDGSRSLVAELEGIDLCVCTADRDGTTDCRENESTTLEGGRGEGQDHPRWWKGGDPDAYSWVADLQKTDLRVDACGYRHEVNAPLRNGDATNDAVITRVHLVGGKLSSQGCQRREIHETWKRRLFRLFAQDYVVWALTSTGSPQDDFPKALPDQIVWTIENIENDHVVLLQSCGRGEPNRRTLFRLGRDRGNEIEIHISNLPAKSVQSTAGPHLEHFRWIYSLVDWSSGKTNCTACDQTDVRLPTPETTPPLDPGAIWGVTSKTAHCSPGDS